MSERFLMVVAVVIFALLALDLVVDDGRLLTMGLRNFASLVEYVSFWR